ncbi:MAG TPA: TonB-dependent receptor [Bacteroidetes bacterium]|nr:TonB-dependent receptor [Bacteroidota bacterium]
MQKPFFHNKILLQGVALLLFLITTGYVTGQRVVTGKITGSDTGEGLPNATVVVKETTRGTISDLDGNYRIELQEGDEILVFTYLGYEERQVEIGNRSEINVELQLSSTALDEVVVVGYGSQKSRDLTAPISTVKGNELSKQVATGVMNAMQGKVAGVQIINSGIPGRGPSVKVRGVGSIGDYANPLYVVDGVFVDNIDFLSASDIEDLTVLKDASAAAIYGVRAANGVILVTTKKGITEKPNISYKGYWGMQVPVNILDMATREQYVTLMNEANVNTPDYVPRDPSDYPASTDWYEELVRYAHMTNHTLDISGSGESTSYSLGGSFLFQDGIMDAKNNYQRFNIRGRLDQTVNEYIKIGVNTIYSRHNKYVPNEGAFFSAYVNPPVYPVYDEDNTEAYPVLFASPQTYGFGNQYGNPVAAAYYVDNFEKGDKLVFSAYAEISLIEDHLTFRSAFNQDQGHYTLRNYTPAFYVGGSQGVRKSDLTKTFGSSSKQIIDNLLTYNNRSGIHTYSVMLGQSTRIEKWENMSGYALDVPGLDDQSKYLVNGSFNDRNAWDDAARYHGLSFFSRGTYNYDGRFLATLTFRADASSKYQKKWGFFPSIGLGWILTSEDFMQNQDWFNFLKARVSWGMLGNDNVPANSTVILGQTGAGSSAVFGDRLVDGIGAQTVLQNYLRWEVVNEFDVGFDFTSKNDKLSGEIDFYHRVTNNVVFYAPIATGGGVAELLGNNGKVLNMGVELGLRCNGKFSDRIGYHIGMNATTVHNRVLELEGRDYIPSGLIRGNYTTRTEVGHPIGSFYGYEVESVYESESQALQDPVSQTIKGAGFFKYRDQNGDDVIDADDKVYLGSAIPWLMTGLDFGMNYNKLDISVSLFGQFGNKILNAKRMNRDVFADGNYDQDFYENRWTPDSKSTDYPSAEAYNYSYIQQANDFFVEDGSFIRIQNVQVGYTAEPAGFVPRLRIYLSAQRPYTFFTYRGFTPEIGGSPISSGIDNSVYPLQAIYTIGLNMNF